MRKESDFLGEVEVPEDAYFGAFTVRANKHFQISGKKVHKEIICAVALIKKCAALTNKDLGKIDAKICSAIVRAADEVISGKFESEFILDAFQAGAGTPLHMNVNEVIANRAEEILGGKKGQYKLVHPNNTVNMSQSSNDVVPTSIRLSSILLAFPLLESGRRLIKKLEEKAKKYQKTLKIGRTHLQDAVPMTYGQTFTAWARALEKDIVDIEQSLEFVRELGIGGTATGSGITAHPLFRKKLIEKLNKENPKLKVYPAKDTIEMTQDMNDFITFSNSLKRYASSLGRIANDIRLLVSGPKAGIAELIIPEIEPGSSIMPGKINPSVPECINLVVYQVMANDLAVTLGSSSGQLELNFFTPLIGENILNSEKILTSATDLFLSSTINDLLVDENLSKENLEKTFGYATALNPYFGYSAVSKLVREALSRNISLRQVILEKELLNESDFEKIINEVGPAEINKEILKRSNSKSKS